MTPHPNSLALPAPKRDLATSVAAWWTILRISIEERLVYRGDFALGSLIRFLPLVTQIFMWGAIFEHVTGATIAGFTFDEMIAYFLLTQIARAFSSMPGLATNIALQIRNGEIKKFLIQPVDLIGFLLLARIAHKLVYYAIATGPYVLVFYLCRGFFGGWPEPGVIVAFVASVLMSFLLGFFMEACLGLVGFWFLEVSSLMFVYMLVSYFCAGQMFPIDMLPGAWATVVRNLPLAYLAYFPAALFLGKISGAGLVWGLIAQAGWVLFFMGLSRVLLKLGIRRYSGFGG